MRRRRWPPFAFLRSFAAFARNQPKLPWNSGDTNSGDTIPISPRSILQPRLSIHLLVQDADHVQPFLAQPAKHKMPPDCIFEIARLDCHLGYHPVLDLAYPERLPWQAAEGGSAIFPVYLFITAG
jgi:hypothetical protein